MADVAEILTRAIPILRDLGVDARWDVIKGNCKFFRTWKEGTLVGKVCSAFTASASQHSGQEIALLGIHVVILHLGRLVTGLPYTIPGQMRIDEILRMFAPTPQHISSKLLLHLHLLC